ncbi:MAG: von Willebrand factor type A domain-containing protein [Chloroflexota bacterium]|nr:von Willebrand factor type A domain-containing protein [Chloroflexota bacterium]MDE2969958.1 von Willebrand factor type A domain-containing protein [Chloroflexota bacterium]
MAEESATTTTIGRYTAPQQPAPAAEAPTAAPIFDTAQPSAASLPVSPAPSTQSGDVTKAASGPAGPQGPVGIAAEAYAPSPPTATNFQDYRQSGFEAAVNDSVSTFSLDTDRTSWQLALNWARSGHRVDPDSVRAEEWINAFSYGYELPDHDDSFAISTDVVPHPLNSGMHLVRVGFQAPEFRDSAPLNVTLVLDASGSMADGNRVAIAREAAEAIRQSLRGKDRIAVVQFTNGVVHDLTVRHTRADDRDVRGSIDQLRPRGSTNVQAGLDLGVRLADRARRDRPDAHNYIILMSDGVANVDATDPFAILESAYDRDASNPLRLITIGVGINNYNDVLLEQLAQHGNGWYRYLSNVNQARATFSRDSWLPLSIPFADQTRAQVRWDPAVVEYWRLVGYENRITSDESFTQDRKEFAEIPMGAATTVFYEVQLRPTAQINPTVRQHLGEVQLRWVTPVEGRSNQQSQTLSATAGRPGDPQNAALLDFGALVALAADRYASLPQLEGGNAGFVQRDLQTIYDRLIPLGGELGGLNSYQDFVFMLETLNGGLPAYPEQGSGYSR